MLSAAWSAVDSWATENCSSERWPTPAAPSSGAPLFPATAAARPAAIAIIDSMLALRTASRARTRCPPSDVAALVRDDPEQLVRVLRAQKQPGVEEDRSARR